MGSPQGSSESESPFFGLFARVAQGNPDNRTQTYENTYVIGAAIATRHASSAAEIIELMEQLQDESTAVEMADLMTAIRDKSDANPRDGREVGEFLHGLNADNRGAAYGTAFMTGLQVGMMDEGWGKSVVKELERTSGKDTVRQLEEQILEMVRRARSVIGLR